MNFLRPQLFTPQPSVTPFLSNMTKILHFYSAKLEYACAMWDPYRANYINLLEFLQNRAERSGKLPSNSSSGLADYHIPLKDVQLVLLIYYKLYTCHRHGSISFCSYAY